MLIFAMAVLSMSVDVFSLPAAPGATDRRYADPALRRAGRSQVRMFAP